VDECLDQGGSYDYEACRCDFSKSHAHKASHRC
jgi:hypothetical protein